MKLIVACLLCLLCTGLCAKEVREKVNSHILANYIQDWSDTRTAHQECSRAQQQSIVGVGTCHSSSTIDMFYIATALAHIGARNVLPNRYGRYLEKNQINFNAHVDEHYSSIDLRLSF